MRPVGLRGEYKLLGFVRAYREENTVGFMEDELGIREDETAVLRGDDLISMVLHGDTSHKSLLWPISRRQSHTYKHQNRSGLVIPFSCHQLSTLL